MNKTMKGALGVSAAAVLLLGGAGSLAYWSDDASVDGGEINSGSLKIDAVNASAPCGAWTHTNGPKAAAADKTVVAIVPGDVITKTCTFVIDAVGDNLAAVVAVPSSVDVVGTPDAGVDSTLSLPVTTSYTLDTAEILDGATITEADDNKVLTATIKVAFPYDATGAANLNDTQNVLFNLDNLTVGLTQANAGV